MKLQFYKKGIPTKYIKRIVQLLIVFCVSIVFFEIYLNDEEEVEVVEFSDPTLPLVNVKYLGGHTTTLHGYVTDMDPCYMRDAIVPLDKERKVQVQVDTKGYRVENVAYEVRSLDTQRKIAGNDIECSKVGELYDAQIQVENLIETGEEYLLIIEVTGQEREIKYYTRIMMPENCHEQECVDFATYFHNTAMSDDLSSLATYIEPDPYTDNETLYKVDITSNLNQIGYGNFDGSQAGDAEITISDINTSYMSLTMYYQMVRGSGKRQEYFNVSEYFRVKYTDERMYLLDYQRTMEEMLDSNIISIDKNLVNVGLTDENIQYFSNETGSIVCFVQSGELYEYNQTERKLKKVFSFVSDDKTDKRSIYNQHKILILNIDESGTMDYVVYGYMNAGDHEGLSGINLYHYDVVSGDSTEQVFIESSESYQILNANFSELLYETSDNVFYIMVSGTLLRMQLNELTTEELMTNMVEQQYAVSNSGRYLAWMEKPKASDAIHILDLETGKSFDIKAGNGQLLIPLDFMQDDLIYGAVYEKNIVSNGAGEDMYPMHKLTITDISGGREKVLKEYQKGGLFVSDIKIDSYTIYLDRVTQSEDGSIVAASQDTIKNSAGEQNKAVPVITEIDEKKGKVVILAMAELDENKKLGKVEFENCGLVSANYSRDVTVSTSTHTNQYFVYVGNTVIMATGDLKTAIEAADSNMGLVLDNSQKYIWKRGKKSYQNSFSGMTVGSGDLEASGASMAISALLMKEGEAVQVHTLLEQGETPVSIMERTLKDYTILDLTGCSLAEVLYYVSIGNPVYARTGEDTAVLLTGYDAASVIMYDPVKGGNTKMSLSDADEYFTSFGNTFVSYLK